MVISSSNSYFKSNNDVVEINGKASWDNDPNNTYKISFDAPTTLTKDSNFNPSIEYYRTTGSGPTWYGSQLRLMTGDFTYSYAGSST